MKHILYWLWLTSKQVINPTKITCLLERFETIEDIYNAKEYNNIQSINAREKKALMDKSLDKAEKILKRTQDIGAKILVFDDKDFPDMLRNIIDPPYVLYLKGEVMQWDRLFTIGVVGTRKCCDYGRIATVNICRGLVRTGVTIVSGMALGIDGIAANTAIRNGGKTIAVLGSGIDVIYPPEHRNLYKAITEHGAVITEYPPGSLGLRHHFPERNRIIAGLSRGVLVTEASIISGSLITARCAFENNRDVFAVPGNILESRYAGTNSIIQSYAKLVTCANDIIDEYPYEVSLMNRQKTEDTIADETYTEKVNDSIQVSIEDKKYAMLDKKEKSIIELLIARNMHVDEIIRETGMQAGELNHIIVMLEIKGLIGKMPGNNYKLKI